MSQRARESTSGRVEWVFVEPQDITHEALVDADALLIRTRTRCNEALLHGTKVQFIATATIGFDQIDTAYCKRHGIAWTNSPGCNAQGVCDYVESALERLGQMGLISLIGPTKPTLGVVGVGHVGSLVAQMAKRRGMNVLLCDPGVESGRVGEWVSLDELAERSDVITFHTPLTTDGPYPTWHLASFEPVPGQTDGFFRHVKPTALIINAARGGVVDEEALLKAGNPCVIDTWEGEPEVNRVLLERALLGTYHIAGYTRMGKYRASQMVLDALCAHFGLERVVIPNAPSEAPHLWDIQAVSDALKAHPERFEQLRENYKLR